ncbi:MULTISPECIES: ABC transporter permease [Pseudomonas]|uniref:ABC transporter permease n=1 Tax=Pseudomonas TaxID=286 RepID=UPI0008EA7357|nr:MULTISPECIES: ABC transporter permease [Pseudomonas]SFT91663.1 ABC-2 type transport system permease protein [Pseudomonas marincola]
MNLRRLGAIILKELRQLRRDRLTFVMIAGVPLLQLVLFGYAINMDVRGINAAVLDQANTVNSREIIAELGSSQVLDLQYHLSAPQEIDALLRQGKISAALVIPSDFEQRRQSTDRPALQLVVDGSDQSIQASTRQLAEFPLPGTTLRTSIEVVNFYNPEREAAINTVPGLLGVILTMTMVIFTAVALVREREHGNLELLIATPVSSWELTIGKVMPFIGIGLIQVSVILIVGKWLFAVPIRGSVTELYVASLLFIIASLGVGIFISTITSTQFQAMQMAFFSFLPQILLSGFMFPFAGMPKAAQWIAELMPLTHYLRLTRGIMLRAASFSDLWSELLILMVFCVVLLGSATARINKRLD